MNIIMDAINNNDIACYPSAFNVFRCFSFYWRNRISSFSKYFLKTKTHHLLLDFLPIDSLICFVLHEVGSGLLNYSKYMCEVFSYELSTLEESSFEMTLHEFKS